MDNSRLQLLFQKYLRQAMSAGEQAEFDQLLDEPGQEQAVKALIDRVIAGTDGVRFPIEGSSREILEAIFRSEGRAPIPMHSRQGTRRIWWIAAASVLFLMLGSATYILWRHQPPQQTASIQQDILPGANGAVLTLGDGSKIVLDSSGAGALPLQGSTRLIQQDKGRLAYESGGASKEVLYNTLSTGRGKQFQVTLPDGSNVWLDAASSLHYPTAFTGKDRRVTVSGQAYFEVAKDPAKPFKVIVGSTEIRVLGTDFNINAYSDEPDTRTTLLSGSIKLTGGLRSLLLKPGQQARFNEAAGLQVVDNADLDQAVAWKNGFTSFTSADLHTIMRQISRWYDVDIFYEGKPSERNFTGEIARNANLSKLLKILTASNIHFRIEGRTLTVLP